MADVTARFSIEDNISAQLDKIANIGQNMCSVLERMDATLNRAFGGMEQGAERAVTSVDGVARSIDSLNDTAEQAARSQNNLADCMENNAQTAESLGEAAEEAARSNEQLGESAQEAGQRGADAMEQLHSAMGSLGIAAFLKKAADGFIACAQAATEFEVALTKIGTIADTTKVPVEQFSADLMELSQRTGIGVGELSEATYQAISASVDTADAVNFTATATKLAAGGFTESATAVDVLTTALNAYGLKAEEAGRISDMLIVSQNLGKTTVAELASNMGKVIPIAAAYGVEMDNLSSAYAELTKGGIQTAEATTYIKGMLNELGSTSSEVSQVLLEQTGQSFAQLTEQGKSLGDIMGILGDSVNGDTGKFNELWSSVEAGIGALALYNSGAEEFNSVLNEMQSQIGATDMAYDKMTNTTAHAMQEVGNSFNNLKIAIGQELNPLVIALSENVTKLTNGFTEFASDNPEVVQGMTAVAAGLGAVLGVMTLVTTAVTVAIPALKKFGIAANTALGPVGWIATAVAGLAAAMAALDAYAEQNAMDSLTVSSQRQAQELENLEERYNAACEGGKQMEAEASRLKYQMDDLSAAFESNKQTLGDFIAENDALCSAIAQTSDTYHKSMQTANTSETEIFAVIQRYDDLINATGRTKAQEKQLEAVTQKLSQAFPELSDCLNAGTANTVSYATALKKAAKEQAEAAKQQAQFNAYVDALGQNETAQKKIAEITDSIDAVKASMDGSDWNHLWSLDKQKELEAYEEELNKWKVSQGEAASIISETEAAWEREADANERAAEVMANSDSAQAVAAIENIKTEIEGLVQSYEDVYNKAAEFMQNQFGLFDKVKVDMEKNAAEVMENARSQTEFRNKMAEGLNELAPKISQFDEEMRGRLTEMSYQYPQILTDLNNMTMGQRSEFVKTLRENDMALKQETDAAAEAVTQANQKMDSLLQEMEEKVKKLDMSTETKTNAEKTIQALGTGIDNMSGGAIAKAQAFVDEINRILSQAGKVDISVPSAGGGTSGKTTTAKPSKTVAATTAARGSLYTPDTFIAGERGLELVARPAAAYARGTLDSNDFFIAGENGPELIMGEPGSTVFPASETDRLIEALTAQRQPLYVPVPTVDNTQKSAAAANGDKKITLELAGNGMLQLNGGGMDKGKVAEVVEEMLRPQIIKTLQDEIFNEGDLSYDY